jgi:uncharacterized membrane protein HdeD (DUF308 family)
MATAAVSEKGSRLPWWLVLIEGILAVIVGAMLLVWPAKTFTALTFFMGIWWFIDGIFDIVSLFMDRTNWGWKLFMGIIGIVAGLFLIQAPLQGALVLAPTYVLLLGFMGVFYGIMGLINAFRGAGWGAGIIGVISIGLGIFLLANVWAAALAVPTVFGIFAIFGGIFAIVFAFRMK